MRNKNFVGVAIFVGLNYLRFHKLGYRIGNGAENTV